MAYSIFLANMFGCCIRDRSFERGRGRGGRELLGGWRASCKAIRTWFYEVERWEQRSRKNKGDLSLTYIRRKIRDQDGSFSTQGFSLPTLL